MSESFKEMLSAVPQFFEIARQSFTFLEREYGYQRHEEIIESAHDYRDANAFMTYLSPKIGVQIYWYFSTGIVDVMFVEVQQPGTFPQKSMFFKNVFWEGKKDISRGVQLSTLASLFGYKNDPSFLLSDYDNVMNSKCKMRIGIIETNLQGVVEGLGAATHRYTVDILKGDTTIFPEVIDYYTTIRLGR